MIDGIPACRWLISQTIRQLYLESRVQPRTLLLFLTNDFKPVIKNDH
ncbi:MAG TPA: hypothetical protein VIO11_06375 [Candidatus Methanoperedens sp.]